MNIDFHYYAAYCAAYIAGFSHSECLDIAYSSQFADCCSRTYLTRIGAPLQAATTQLPLELMDADTDPPGLQDITRIWASFHFLPYDLYASRNIRSRRYMNKFRLICGPDGDLSVDTVELAKGRTLQAQGLAMHVIADTWAHRYFAGTPSLVINDTNYHFFELVEEDGEEKQIQIAFRHSPTAPDDIDAHIYNNSLSQHNENSIMNLGHGRAGHFPDMSFMRYRYMPAWNNYEEVLKDNPADYYNAFCQLIYALRYYRGEHPSYEKGCRDYEAAEPYREQIMGILKKRQMSSVEDWRAFGQQLSGREVEYFNADRYTEEYISAPADGKDGTFLGRFIIAALAQKSMVTNKIFRSGNLLAGYSVEYGKTGYMGIKDFIKLVGYMRETEERRHE